MQRTFLADAGTRCARNIGAMSAAAHSFDTLFGNAPQVRARAAGLAVLARDERRLIAATIPLETIVLLGRRRDPVVHAASANVDGPARMVYVLGEETRWGAWVDRVQRVTAMLREEGMEISGFDVLVKSAIPIDSGLAAGSALTVAVLRALRQAFTLSMNDEDLARIAMRAVEDARAAAIAHGEERSAIVLEGGAHRRLALPAGVELRVLAGESETTAPPLDSNTLLAALEDGSVERLVQLFDDRRARQGSETLAERAISRTATLALVRRASSSQAA